MAQNPASVYDRNAVTLSIAVGRNDLRNKCHRIAMHSEGVPLLAVGRLFQSRLRVYAQKSVGAPTAYPRLLSGDAFSVLVPPAILFHKTFWAFMGCRDAACRVLDLAFPLQKRGTPHPYIYQCLLNTRRSSSPLSVMPPPVSSSISNDSPANLLIPKGCSKSTFSRIGSPSARWS